MSVEWEGPGWAGLVLPIWGMCLFGLTFSSPGKEVQRLGLGRPEGKAGLEAAGLMEERREAGEAEPRASCRGRQGYAGDLGGVAGGLKRRGGLPSASAQCPACKQQLLSGYQGQGKG